MITRVSFLTRWFQMEVAISMQTISKQVFSRNMIDINLIALYCESDSYYADLFSKAAVKNKKIRIFEYNYSTNGRLFDSMKWSVLFLK